MALDAVRPRPAAFGHVVGAEEPVEQREMDGEVDIECLALLAVVPVVEAGRGNVWLHRLQVPAHIGVDEGRIEIDDQQVDLDRQRLKPNVNMGMAVTPRSTITSRKCMRAPAIQSMDLAE